MLQENKINFYRQVLERAKSNNTYRASQIECFLDLNESFVAHQDSAHIDVALRISAVEAQLFQATNDLNGALADAYIDHLITLFQYYKIIPSPLSTDFIASTIENERNRTQKKGQN